MKQSSGATWGQNAFALPKANFALTVTEDACGGGYSLPWTTDIELTGGYANP